MTLIFLILFSRSAVAHHAFAIEFDANSPVQLTGKITKFELSNPHSYIHISVQQPGKPDQGWTIECAPPKSLFAAGLSRDSLKVGMTINVRGYQSRDHLCKPECKANGREVTLPDGKAIFTGSSGTGAPHDGADPNEHSPHAKPDSAPTN